MSVTTAAVWIFLVLSVLVAILVSRARASKRTVAQLEAMLTPVDASALGNLLHEREDAFLRANLAPRAYRRIKRKRVRAAQEYVWNISRNALVLSRIAGLALDSVDPEIHRTAQKFANDAVELRRYAILTFLLLTMQVIYPDFQMETLKLRERYTSLAESASWFYRLRFPESRIRINAALCG
jgi:hypothetical protein